MRVLVFEGSPEEVSEALRELGLSTPPAAAAPTAKAPAAGDGGEEALEAGEEELKFVSTTIARRAITRIPLADLPKKMLAEVYEAADVGILGSALARKLGYNPAQFRGLMGAFGRRLSNTPGYNGTDHFFRFEWDYAESSYRYWLPETVREAVRIEIIEKK